MGPLLFLIYINDIELASTYFNILIYADDTTLSRSLTVDDFKNIVLLNLTLNAELGKISTWLKVNKLSLNAKKSQFMLFRRSTRKFDIPQIKIDNTPLKNIDSFNFLGITLQKDLKWETHINNISCKIAKTLGIMNKLKHYVPKHILLTIYSSLVLPYIHYGILLWGYNKNRIFKLQKRAVRIITLSNYISHSEPIFKTLNLLNIDDIHKMNQYKFIHKLYNSSLPAYFNSLPLTSLSDIRQHNTRNKFSSSP